MAQSSENTQDQRRKTVLRTRQSFHVNLIYGNTRVESKSGISNDIPPGLILGRDDRKLGLGGKQEPQATLKTVQKVERDTNSILAAGGNDENIPSTEKAPMPGGATDWGNYQNWYSYMNYQNWSGVINWGQIPMPPIAKSSFPEGGIEI